MSQNGTHFKNLTDAMLQDFQSVSDKFDKLSHKSESVPFEFEISLW